MARRAASYVGLQSSSDKASAAARGSSRKRNTKPELLLRGALRRLGIRATASAQALPGRPDFVFARKRVVVFVDGDYWHGRRWSVRKKKLASVHNATYWLAKISGNRRRDRKTNAKLRDAGWIVLRFWETDIAKDPDAIALKISAALATVSAV
ncbi:MAG TPA: DNA mismatch endonuclease Vsr [Polyangiales bacterium]